MITTIGGVVDFSAANQDIVFNLQIPKDENWDFISCQANVFGTELMRVRIFLNTILTYDLIFVGYCLPYIVNQRLNGGTVIRLELERVGISTNFYGAFMEINRVKS